MRRACACRSLTMSPATGEPADSQIAPPPGRQPSIFNSLSVGTPVLELMAMCRGPISSASSKGIWRPLPEARKCWAMRSIWGCTAARLAPYTAPDTVQDPRSYCRRSAARPSSDSERLPPLVAYSGLVAADDSRYRSLVARISVGTKLLSFSGRMRSTISPRSSSSGKVKTMGSICGGRGMRHMPTRVTMPKVD
ncbi:hypothetical protein G6F57_018851 [Rhizopus arrhizus]|nr:hypothetical protein G6F57_018851 [Rhizopus arrhizus]